MAKGKWRLVVRSEFCAGHALRNYQGKCENVHGHNFAVELAVEGDTLTKDTEILVDFAALKKALREALENLDHRVLNDCPPFDVINPSSENIARHLYRELKPALLAHKVRPYSVSVSEKAAQSAIYMEDDD